MEKISLEVLNAYLGQLIDLETGFVKELVIKTGKDAEILRQIISDRIGLEKEKQKAEVEQKKVESLN